MSDEPLVGPEEMAGVLSGMGTAPAPSERPVEGEPAPYSLREPVAIPPQAEAEARERVEALVAAIRAVLPEDSGIDVELDALQQQRAAAAMGALPQPAWIVSFAREGGGGLAFAFPSVVALRLVEVALGGRGSGSEDAREPTPVEARVLPRLFTPATPAFRDVVGEPLAPLGLGVGQVPGRLAAPGETVGVGLLRVKLEGSEHGSLLLVTPSMLAGGREAAAEPATARPPGPLARRLETLPARCRPVLRAGRVSLAELTELEPGKLLVLDAAEDAAIELRVEGRATFAGTIVRENGTSVFAATRRRGRAPATGRKP